MKNISLIALALFTLNVNAAVVVVARPAIVTARPVVTAKPAVTTAPAKATVAPAAAHAQEHSTVTTPAAVPHTTPLIVTSPRPSCSDEKKKKNEC